jgi:hypothetical protein
MGIDNNKARKGLALGDLPQLAILFVVAFVVMAIGAQISGTMQTSFLTSNGNGTGASNITSNLTSGLVTMASYGPTIATVLAGALVIGILVSSFLKQVM